MTGPARRLLTGRKPATKEGYVELRRALVERYEPTNQEETYKAFLRTRERKPGEELQALEEDLTKFTRLGYPEADAKTTDTLVLDRFLLCLEPQLRQWVYQTQPKDLQTAVMTSVVAEAYLRIAADRTLKVRAADATVTEHLKSSSDRIDKLAEAMENLVKKVESNGGAWWKKAGGTACFGCGQEGHFKRECPKLAVKQSGGKDVAEKPADIQTAAGN